MRVTKLTKMARILLFITVLALQMFLPKPSEGFDKRLQLGLSAGYSATYLRKDNWPNIFGGVALGGFAEYGINRVFAISVEGATDLHLPYTPQEKTVVIGEDGKEEIGYERGRRVDKYFHSTGAISVLYAIDLFRIVPVFSVGFVATREDKRFDGEHQTVRLYGFRIGGGFEYYLKYFSFGAGVYSDRYVANENKEITNRLCLSIRGAYVFDFGAKSLE